MYWILGAIGVALGGWFLLGKTQTAKGVERVDCAGFSEYLGEEGVQLVDVRTAGEYSSGHLKGANNIDFFDSGFAHRLGELDTTKTLLLYCRSGNRSGKAARKASDMGFARIVDLSGGISAWQNEGRPTVK